MKCNADSNDDKKLGVQSSFSITACSTFCNCGFGILVNFDAVLRFFYVFPCGFRTPLTPPSYMYGAVLCRSLNFSSNKYSVHVLYL